MRGAGLGSTIAFSTFLHVTIIILSALVLRQTGPMIMPSPYVVSLVGPGPSGREAAGGSSVQEEKVTRKESKAPTAPIEKPAQKPVEKPSKKKTVEDKKDERRIEEKISEIASLKKIEKIMKLRSVLSVGGKSGQAGKKSPEKGTGTGGAKGGQVDKYYAKITDDIRHEWVYPETGDKSLEAVISVKIMKDGTISVLGVEKSSGNLLFDKSALRAIAKASPVAPPPNEMEIGIRFYP